MIGDFLVIHWQGLLKDDQRPYMSWKLTTVLSLKRDLEMYFPRDNHLDSRIRNLERFNPSLPSPENVCLYFRVKVFLFGGEDG